MRVPLALLLGGLSLVAAGAGHADPEGRSTLVHVDHRVLEDTAGGRTGHFLVRLRASTERSSRAGAIVHALRETAATAQPGAMRELARLGARVRPYWIVNALAVEGGRAAVEAMAARPDVLAIEPDRAFRGLTAETGRAAPVGPRAVEWNVAKIGAPGLWALGATGQGTVYANADTGVVWDHPALKARYRGWNGVTATHDYNWWDAVHADIDGLGANLCGFNLKAPCDDDRGSHGTHAMGTAVGDDGAGNQIGVAPGARWISCRNMEEGIGRPSTYIECLQFFVAPTDLSGANPDPSKRPNAIGNSYSCPPDEACTVGSLQQAVETVRAAGIFVSVSAGNEGPGCSTIAFPPSVYDASVTVGSTGPTDVIATTSSRGPVLVDGSLRRKPDLVAPGVSIRSSVREGYGFKSGTSMAAPHVGAAALLLWSAIPGLRGNVDRTEELLRQTAVKLAAPNSCGGDTPSQLPNNTYGFGRIDVLAAHRAAAPGRPSSLSAADASVREGDRGTTTLAFVVKLAPAAAGPVEVAYRTADGTAKAARDYVRAAGTLSFEAGQTEQRLRVRIVADRVVERHETFLLHLSAATNAALGRRRAVATIRNDDVDRTPPRLSRLRAVASGSVRFLLSEPAAVTLTVERGARRIIRLAVAGRAGRNVVPLRTQLAPGDYRVTAVARDRAGNLGAAAHATFTVG